MEQKELPSDLRILIEQVEKFIWPPTESLIQGEKFTKRWEPNEGWKIVNIHSQKSPYPKIF